MKSNKDNFKMTGGLPPLIKARAELAAANKAATDADIAVKAAADALRGIQEAVGNSSDAQMKTAVADATEALKMATDAQKKAYADKKVAGQSMLDADSKRTSPAGD
jgi:hypothetical protein